MAAHKILATVALLAMFGAAHAARVLDQPERSYEISLSQMTLPTSASGGVTVKACDACAYSTHVMTASTEYFVNHRPVAFEDFSRIAAEVRANRRVLQTAVAGVFIDVETGRVNRVTLVYRGQ